MRLAQRQAAAKFAGRIGQVASPTSRIRKRRVTQFRNISGPLAQQQMAARGMYRQTAQSAGINRASLLNKLAFRGYR